MGNALSSVSGLALNGENYVKAIKILTDRFGRKDLVINAHMTKLLNLPLVRKRSDLVALRQLYDTCEIQIRSLESFGVNSSSFGSLLCPVLMKRLPDELSLEFSRSCEVDSEWSVDRLLKFIRKELESRERAAALSQPREVGQLSSDSVRKTGLKSPTRIEAKSSRVVSPSTAALIAGVNAKPEDGRCIFCRKDDHRYRDCKGLTHVERKVILKKLGRCFACTKEGHMARDCRNKRRLKCETCSRRHDESVCDQRYPEKKGTEETRQTTIMMTGLNRQVKGLTPTIYLQTANVVAISEASSQLTRCLLDTGSQQTFIRQDFSRALQLPVLGIETLTVHSFEWGAPRQIERKRVILTLRNVHGSEEITIEALETPVAITSALIQSPHEDIRKEMAKRGKRLADGVISTSESNEELSILIGPDYYWRIVRFNIERITENLAAVDTIFGWIIHGPSSISTLNVGVMSVLVTMVNLEDVEDEGSLSKLMKASWELDSIGIVEQPTNSQADEEIMESFESTIKFLDGRYEVRLPTNYPTIMSWRKEIRSTFKEV